jgi:hypothetical protein
VRQKMKKRKKASKILDTESVSKKKFVDKSNFRRKNNK